MKKFKWFGLLYKGDIIMVLSSWTGRHLTIDDFDGHDVEIPSGCEVVEVTVKVR